jgi:hypothetical protein
MSQKNETPPGQSRDSEYLTKNKCLGGCLALKSLAVKVLTSTVSVSRVPRGRDSETVEVKPLKNRDTPETVARHLSTDAGDKWPRTEAQTVLDTPDRRRR